MSHASADNTDIFGFWIYILSDCILFSMLFSAFAVLHNNVYGGPILGSLFNIPYIFIETLLLLSSSLTFGLAILASYKNHKTMLLNWLGVTFILGFAFVGMELSEFYHLYLEGYSWQSSAALSSFFTLVGTHGLHVTIGLLWMVVTMLQLMMFGINPIMEKRLTYLGLFWTFLDIVWIFVFTIVYLMEAM